MKRKKRFKVISLLLAVIMILSSLPFAGISALAATSGDFEYEILEDGTAEITDYNGSAETLEISSTLDGYTVTSIGDYAFRWCYSLTSVTIPDSVTSIGYSAFENCDSLTSVTIPNSVTSIGNEAFDGCENLTSVTIPNSVTSIGNEAFASCDSLTNITIPCSVTSIGNMAFWSCDSLTNITVDENNENYSSQDGVLFNKEKTELIQYPIGNERTSYNIPDSVTSIGSSAFKYCHSLTSITIPSSVTNIGNDAFSYTGYYNDDTNWKNGVLYIGNRLINTNPDEIPSEYSINEGTVTIANSAFSNCDSLTSVTIPDSVTSIGNYAFYSCNSLTSVDLGNSVTSIGDYVFIYCGNLTSITIPDSVTSIGDDAFYGCDNLASVELGKCVTSIGYRAFCLCRNLTSITIPDSVTSISDYAFVYCDNLTSITMPNGVISIGIGAFGGTGYSNDDANWENGVLYIGNHLIATNNNEIPSEYSINEGTVTIADVAFWDCTSLTSITIPNSVTSIGDDAFYGSALEIIYGYENSYAQTYAEEYRYIFVAIHDFENSESGITVDTDKSELPEDTELVVTVKEETENSVTYDISLQSGGAEVHPTGSVTVKIPVPDTMDGESVKVYRREPDGTMTDMNAVYNEGFMVFTTEHFSEYKLTTASGTPGDVNGDGKINALDVLIVKRYIAKYDDAKLEGDQFALADVSGDGKVNAKDALAIMQKIAKLITSFDEIK